MYRIFLSIAYFLLEINTLLLSNATVSLANRQIQAISAGLAHLTIIAPYSNYSDFQVIVYNLTTGSFAYLGPVIDSSTWEIQEIKGLNTLEYNSYLTIGNYGWYSFNNLTTPRTQLFSSTNTYLSYGKNQFQVFMLQTNGTACRLVNSTNNSNIIATYPSMTCRGLSYKNGTILVYLSTSTSTILKIYDSNKTLIWTITQAITGYNLYFQVSNIYFSYCYNKTTIVRSTLNFSLICNFTETQYIYDIKITDNSLFVALTTSVRQYDLATCTNVGSIVTSDRMLLVAVQASDMYPYNMLFLWNISMSTFTKVNYTNLNTISTTNATNTTTNQMINNTTVNTTNTTTNSTNFTTNSMSNMTNTPTDSIINDTTSNTSINLTTNFTTNLTSNTTNSTNSQINNTIPSIQNNLTNIPANQKNNFTDLFPSQHSNFISSQTLHYQKFSQCFLLEKNQCQIFCNYRCQSCLVNETKDSCYQCGFGRTKTINNQCQFQYFLLYLLPVGNMLNTLRSNSAFSVIFLFDTIQLYRYHKIVYNGTIQKIFEILSFFQNQKLNIAPIDTIQDWTSQPFDEQNSYNNFTNSKFLSVQRKSSLFFESAKSYYAVFLPATFLQFLFLNKIFFRLRKFKVSVAIRSYSFWLYLIVIQFISNAPKLLFYCFSHMNLLFSLSTSFKLLHSLCLTFIGLFFIFLLSIYFMSSYFYGKYQKYFLINTKPIQNSLFYIFFNFSVRPIIQSAAHVFLYEEGRSLLILLILVEIVNLLIMFYLQLKYSLFQQKTIFVTDSIFESHYILLNAFLILKHFDYQGIQEITECLEQGILVIIYIAFAIFVFVIINPLIILIRILHKRAQPGQNIFSTNTKKVCKSFQNQQEIQIQKISYKSNKRSDRGFMLNDQIIESEIQRVIQINNVDNSQNDKRISKKKNQPRPLKRIMLGHKLEDKTKIFVYILKK